MGDLLQVVLIVFMVFLCLLCMFAVFVIIRDLLKDSKSKTNQEDEDENEQDQQQASAPAPIPVQIVNVPLIQAQAQPLATVAPTAEPEQQPAPAPQKVAIPVEVEDENSVTFSSQSYTMEEKYLTLSSEYRRMFDEIVRHALTKPNVKEYKHNGSYDYKDGSYRVVRMTIRRGEPVCEFQFINRDFINYVSASNVKMKQSSTVVRVQELATVGVVKDGIDLVCNQIVADREYKKEQARARRREKRRQQQNANQQVVEEA